MFTLKLYSSVLTQFEELHMGDVTSDDLVMLIRVAANWEAGPAHRATFHVASERLAELPDDWAEVAEGEMNVPQAREVNAWLDSRQNEEEEVAVI